MAEKEFIKVDVKQEDGTSKEVSIYVKKPTNNIISASDRHRAKVWNKCLVDDILTKAELGSVLRERDIWDDEKAKETEDILKQISKLEKELYGVGSTKKTATVSDGRRLAIRMRELRIKLRDIMSEKIALEENTAEAIAENAKFDYLVSECTMYDNGERVYSSLDDYSSKSSDEIAFAAAGQLANMLFALDPNFEKNLPENKFLADWGLVDEKMNVVNKQQQRTDKEGRRIDDQGRFLDDDGGFIDIDGNKLDADGTYVMQLKYHDDTEPAKPAKKQTATRKKTVPAES